jgi:hypothetical protein
MKEAGSCVIAFKFLLNGTRFVNPCADLCQTLNLEKWVSIHPVKISWLTVDLRKERADRSGGISTRHDQQFVREVDVS